MNSSDDKRVHLWQAAVAEDNSGNKYAAQVCKHCEYLVVGFPKLDKEAHHEPQYSVILVKSKTCEKALAEKWSKHFGVACEDAEDDTNTRIVGDLSFTISSHV